jgi:hypothetical protein
VSSTGTICARRFCAAWSRSGSPAPAAPVIKAKKSAGKRGKREMNRGMAGLTKTQS